MVGSSALSFTSTPPRQSRLAVGPVIPNTTVHELLLQSSATNCNAVIDK